MKTFLPKEPGDSREWVMIDAEGKPLGRVAAKIADILRGKHKATYTPHVDTGAFVLVVNAQKVRLTGKKDSQKVYKRYTGHWSGLKETPAATMRERHPDRMIRFAVRGMLAKNNMCRKIIRRLKVFPGAEHPHAAQRPVTVEIN